jgi:small-conductance mechanosensitive channel
VQLSPQIARDLSEQLSRALAERTAYWSWLERGIRVAIILGGAWLITRLAARLFPKLRMYTVQRMSQHGEVPALELEKRTKTIASVLTKVVSALVWIVAAVMALNELTFNIQPLLAGLGVAGLALGLGAQTLIKDLLGGLFMLIEDQIRIGDGVSINGVGGAVEEINLRTTVLRSENGAVHIIPNGAITQLANFTREYSYYVFEVTVAHTAKVNRALEILRETGARIAAEPEFAAVILAPLEVMGVERLTDRGSLIRARIKTLPSKQALVGRELNLRVKEAYDGAGIVFPVPGP